MRRKKNAVQLVEGVSKFRILYDWLGIYIEGRPKGERLPSENELVEQHGFSRITVRRAYGMLERARKVRRRKGSGTYIR